MAGYTKLFSTIITSTIWREDDKTRLVWITMLALADQFGKVDASIPGLADAARISIPECEISLQKLLNPDKYSRTQDYEGRRIMIIDGGWLLLNYGKYREKINEDERREYLRRKQAEHRAKCQKPVNKCQQMSTNVNKCQHKQKQRAEAEAEEKEAKEKEKQILPTTSTSNSLLFAKICKDSDLCKERFAEMFPLALPREKNTIGKLIRNCTHIAQKNPAQKDALKTLLSLMHRCQAEAVKNPLGWLVDVARKEIISGKVF